MLNKYLLLLVLCTAVLAQTFAQKDYVITVKYDTVYGKVVSTASMEDKVVLKQKDQNAATFYPQDLMGFQAGNLYYQSVRIEKANNKSVFLVRLVSGDITLLQYRNSFVALKGDQQILLEKNNVQSSTTLKEDKRYIGLLNSFMFDCKPASRRLSNLEFYKTDIINAVVKYNTTCGKTKTTTATGKRHKNTLGVIVGLTSSGISYRKESSLNNYLSSIDHTNRISPTFGLFYNVQTNGRLSFQPQLLYISKGAYAENAPYGTTQTIDSDYRLTGIQIPIQVQCRLSEKVPLYLLGGMVSDFYIFENTITRKVYDNNTSQVLTEKIEVNKAGLGFRFGFGYTQRVGSLNLTLEYHYERVNPKMIEAETNMPVNAVVLKMGF